MSHHGSSHPAHPSRNHLKHAQNPNKRPSSIAELADRAMDGLWDESKDFKTYLRLAEKHRKDGKDCVKRGDLEGAFVELARAATLVLEKLPSHKDYYAVLSPSQRQNLGLNGQDILESLSDLKPSLVERYDKWLQKHPDAVEHISDRTPNARGQKTSNGDAASVAAEQAAQREREEAERAQQAQAQAAAAAERERQERARRDLEQQQRLVAEEAARWKRQREQTEAQLEVDRARRKEAAAAAARKAATVPRIQVGSSQADLTFSKTPMQAAGYGSQNTVVIHDPRTPQPVARQSSLDSQHHEDPRSYEEEQTRRRNEQTRKQQEGIARRQQEAEEQARAARRDFSATQNLTSPAIQPYGTPSTVATVSPMFPSATTPSSLATTPSGSFYQPTPSTIEYPRILSTSNSRQQQPNPHQPPRQGNYLEPYPNGPGPQMMPLESPRYEGDSTDSESLYNFDWSRANKQRTPQHRTPTRPVRSPSYPPPITTTSPIPGAVPIRYPSLMSHHQRTQGYYPSLNSIFTEERQLGPNGLLFGGDQGTPPSVSSAAGATTSQYSASRSMPVPPQSLPLLPPPLGSHQAYQPYANRPPPPLPPNSGPPPPPQPQSSSTPTPHQPVPPPPSSFNSEDRIVIPSSSSSNLDPKPLKTVSLPRECLTRFIAIAKPNTEVNLETCGLLLGKDKGHKFSVTTLLIPKQHSTSDTCTMDEEELVLQFTEERNLITLGWIHTHPSQSCFMSSVDLHTHSGFQRMLPESFAVVCAPKSNPNFGIFRLTDPPGLKTILECTAKEAFHPHPDVPIYTDADKGHVRMKDSSLEIVDLR